MEISIMCLGGWSYTVEITQKQYEGLLEAWRTGDKWYVLRASCHGYPMDIEVPVGNIVAITYERDGE